jgi:hypothetical protein
MSVGKAMEFRQTARGSGFLKRAAAG